MLIGPRILIPLDKNSVALCNQESQLLADAQDTGRVSRFARQTYSEYSARSPRGRARSASSEQQLPAQERQYRNGLRPQRDNDLRERKPCLYRQDIPRFCRKHRHPSRRLDSAAQLRWEPRILEPLRAREQMRERPRRRQSLAPKERRAASLNADGCGRTP